MQENYELVQKGFRILLSSMSGFIGQKMRMEYRDKWWDKVLYSMKDTRNLPFKGDYAELIDSLDIANCLRVISAQWTDVFCRCLSYDCLTWSKELMGVRNVVSHIGQQDFEQPMAERALDTMYLLCREMDSEGAEEIYAIYKEIRSRADETKFAEPAVVFSGLAQPESESKTGGLKEGGLLSLVGTDFVEKTMQTRKITFAGKTTIYPVYKVRLDALYYNDQNDRIATWISGYESENGEGSLTGLNRDIYNRIIESFIIESNPEAITKTKNNISLFGQREAGVTLADGRIVDGNRRFTCLRNIQRESLEPVYFETAIIDVDINADKKQIKLLELAIQHGEESKVAYDFIDHSIGTYRDIVETKLLTVEEYAASANESAADVKKRLEVAELIIQFLDYLGLPKQYHIAREYGVSDMFREMLPALKNLNDEDKESLKKIAFNNIVLKAIPDQRKFIRDIRSLINKDSYDLYFKESEAISADLTSRLEAADVQNKADLDKLMYDNSSNAEKMKATMEKALQRMRSGQLKSRPSENITKCISLAMDIDPRMFDKMDPDEKNTLKTNLDNLINITKTFRELLN